MFVLVPGYVNSVGDDGSLDGVDIWVSESPDLGLHFSVCAFVHKRSGCVYSAMVVRWAAELITVVKRWLERMEEPLCLNEPK